MRGWIGCGPGAPKRGNVRSPARAGAVVLASAFLWGCSLQDVTLVEVEDVVVAEVLVMVEDSATHDLANRVSAFLHRTVGGAGAGFHPVPGARIEVRRSDGLTLELAEAPLEECVATLPVDGTGSCYLAAPAAAGRLRSGDSLSLTVTLPGGGVLEGRTTVPGAFSVENVVPGDFCRLAPGTPLELRWSPSEGAWAYVNETNVYGLPPLFPELDLEDPLYLLGLSVSAADTTIVFPGEFGVFNRFEVERAVSLALQEGLPAGTWAEVSITAVDRNYVNWVRGGNFNPSGQVRVSSLAGDGIGLFGAATVRRFAVTTDAADPRELASCIP